MALQQGERYRCTMENCECEIEVTKGAGPAGGSQAPRCCCGMEMQRA
jgi:hypothetical protein